MKKRLFPFLFALLFLFLSGCAAKTAFKFQAAAYVPNLKDVPIYKETVPLNDVALTEDNLDWLSVTLGRYDDIFNESLPAFQKRLSSDLELNAEWYDSFRYEASSLQASCSNFLKTNAPDGLQDIKTLADIQIIGLYNAIEDLKSAVSKGNDSAFASAKVLADSADSDSDQPYDYLESLYDRYPFSLSVTSVKVKNGSTRLFVRFKNSGDATVSQFYFVVECRDISGNPVQLDNAFDQMNCTYDSPKLKSGSVSGSLYYWRIGRFEDGYEFRVALTRYKTTDGTIVVCKPEEYKWTEWVHQ